MIENRSVEHVKGRVTATSRSIVPGLYGRPGRMDSDFRECGMYVRMRRLMYYTERHTISCRSFIRESLSHYQEIYLLFAGQ